MPTPLLDSLLAALTRADGDALVMHAGEAPYIVAPSGQLELTTHGMDLPSMGAVVAQVLPEQLQAALAEYGAVEHPLPRRAPNADRFSVVVARGGQDVWVEIRRHRRARAGDGAVALVVNPEAEEALNRTTARRAGTDSSTATDRPQESDVRPGVEELDATAPPPAASDVSGAIHEEPPLTRMVRIEVPSTPSARASDGSFDGPFDFGRLLATAATRGAAAVYLITGSVPYLRIDDELQPCSGDPVPHADEIEAAIRRSLPDTRHAEWERDARVDWSAEESGVYRADCVAFRDQRGPGATFHLATTRPWSMERLGLPEDMQALAGERQGLVVLASPRGHGRSTLAAAYVDAIARQRRAYVITVEQHARVVHEPRLSLVSQRTAGESGTGTLNVVQAALAERPDVLLLDAPLSRDVLSLAFEASDAGALVLVTVEAASAGAALHGLLAMSEQHGREAAADVLSTRVRGVVAQVLLRRVSGGTVAARECLLGTDAAAAVRLSAAADAQNARPKSGEGDEVGSATSTGQS